MSKHRFTLGHDNYGPKESALGTLWANCNSGEGDITVKVEGFGGMDAMRRMSVLKDWIRALQIEYDITYDEFYKNHANRVSGGMKSNEVNI